VKELKIEHATTTVGNREVQILRLEGYVDAHTFTDFEEELTKLVEGGHYSLLLDLEKLTYINSTGLGLLMATFRQVRQHEHFQPVGVLAPDPYFPHRRRSVAKVRTAARRPKIAAKNSEWPPRCAPMNSAT
jgi:anti-anti-sigma factor